MSPHTSTRTQMEAYIWETRIPTTTKIKLTTVLSLPKEQTFNMHTNKILFSLKSEYISCFQYRLASVLCYNLTAFFSGMIPITIKSRPNHKNCSLCPGVIFKHRGPPTYKTSWQDWSLEILAFSTSSLFFFKGRREAEWKTREKQKDHWTSNSSGAATPHRSIG